jgi:radical SAM protein with 4Fe4S-binding SPASM domain
VQISTTVHPGNYERVKDVVTLAEYLSATSVYFRFLSDWGRAKENDMGSQMEIPLYIKAIRDISALSRKKRDTLSIYLGSPPGIVPDTILVNIEKLCYGCDFPVIGVLPDGGISFCGLASYYTMMVLGNFRREKIRSIWERNDIVQRLENFDSDDLEGVCGMCIFRHQCRGSCRIDAYALSKSFLGPYPLCDRFYREGKFPKSHLE